MRVVFLQILLIVAAIPAWGDGLELLQTSPVNTIGLKYRSPTVSGSPRDAKSELRLSLDESLKPTNKRSVVLASLVLPGWGERMLDASPRGAFFTTAEAALWFLYAGFKTYGVWRENDYRNFAIQHASVDPENKDGQYWIDIANFDNIHEFNTQRLRDRQPDRVYRVSSTMNWDWNSFEQRYKYDTMRIESRKMAHYAVFALGGIVVNHIVSALDATYLYNTRYDNENETASVGVSIPFSLR